MKANPFIVPAIITTLLTVFYLVSPSRAQVDEPAGAFVRVDELARQVDPPSVVTVTTNAQTVITGNTATGEGRVLLRTVQNTGTNAVLFAINATVSLTNYHGILAGGVAVRDGLGSVLDLSRAGTAYLSVMTASGTSVVAIANLTQ
jgi:hypothetical protein